MLQDAAVPAALVGLRYLWTRKSRKTRKSRRRRR